MRVHCRCLGFTPDLLGPPVVELADHVRVDSGDIGLAEERDKVRVYRLDVVLVDLAACARVQLPLHVLDRKVCDVLEPLCHNRQVVLFAELLVEVLIMGDTLGVLKITLPCADPHPAPADLERCLPALGLGALVDLDGPVHQHMRVVV